MKEGTKEWHLKQGYKYIQRIQRLRPEDGMVFLRYKKKANRHLEEARRMEAVEQQTRRARGVEGS